MEDHIIIATGTLRTFFLSFSLVCHLQSQSSVAVSDSRITDHRPYNKLRARWWLPKQRTPQEEPSTRCFPENVQPST